MSVYLIDFENVTSAGISGIQRLSKEDKVYIFYSKNASNMSFSAHINLLQSSADVTYLSVDVGGKNALDFQLSSFLGYLINSGEEKHFIIISNDKGYDYVKSFWEKNGLAPGVTINGAPSINRALLPIERPFTAKIQQGSVPLERLKTEADKYAAQKAAAEAAANAGTEKSEEISAEKAESSAPNKGKTEKIDEKTGNSAKAVANESVSAYHESEEKKPARRRGRPKGKKSETKAPTDANEEFSSANSAKNVKKAENTALSSLRAAVARVGVASENEISEIIGLLISANGKQQFYRGLLKIFGMEKGVEVYKVIRPEYTNLTKLVKQP